MTVGSELSELSILGKRNILSKVFVSEALTCEDPVESHLYDILENEGKPMLASTAEKLNKKIFIPLLLWNPSFCANFARRWLGGVVREGSP